MFFPDNVQYFRFSPSIESDHIQNDSSDHENGLDMENDDDYPIIDDMDNDPNDMNRPRKIRR